jgi:hypothetical protein
MANTLLIDQLGLAIESPNSVFSSTRSYRPPSWPPPKDWVCIEDVDGNPVSRWGDPVWDLSPWAGSKLILNFGDGPKLQRNSIRMDGQNADLLRIAMTWRIWGFRGLRAAKSIVGTCLALKPIFAACSRNGILASDLSRYPRVVEEIARDISPSVFSMVINELHILAVAREFIGFTILDSVGMSQLKALDPNHNHRQTEFIPPRIYQYQIKRLKEFIDDYLLYQTQIEGCYGFCVDAYLKFNDKKANANRRGPFSNSVGANRYRGSFLEVAEQFGIKGILEKWVGLNPKIGIKLISTYLNMASYVGLAYTLNFTLARVSEGMNLRFNCLKWHDDEVYGRIPLIEGRTTKTIENDDALWVASPSVECAVIVMQSVATVRGITMSSKSQRDNIFLMSANLDPWKKVRKNLALRPRAECFSIFLADHPLLFDEDELIITEEDFKIAIAASPTLDQNKFCIGKPWIFAWHQLRRTGAVNMFSSGEISDASIQLQLKHLSPIMTQYYGRGHTTLSLSEDIKSLIVNAQYEAMGQRLAETQSDRFISPFGAEHKEALISGCGNKELVNLIDEDRVAKYQKAARAHQINFRVTAVGVCMKNGRCDGDGFSALGDCAGGSGRAPCANALFDRNRVDQNKIRLEMVIKQIESTQPDTLRHRYLEQERRGLENFFAYIR